MKMNFIHCENFRCFFVMSLMTGQDRFSQMILYCLMHYCVAFDEEAASDLKMLDAGMMQYSCQTSMWRCNSATEIH